MRALLALCCGIALGAQAESFDAEVIVVIDGDTVVVLREGGSEAAGHPPAYPSRVLREGGSEAAGRPPTSLSRGRQKIKVRLVHIDAPEKAQAFGKQSRDSLQELIGKKPVRIDSRAVDQYGRIVGTVWVGGRNVNQEQVQRGMAWAEQWQNRRPTPEAKEQAPGDAHIPSRDSGNIYLKLQNAARQARRGLWSQTDPQAPWQWRKQHPWAKPDAFASRHGTAGTDELECGKKSRCREMRSCDEARFYLANCGIQTLDGNRDGIPCESLCGGK
ncbi:MAG: thermonuclease family protein [Nitrosomonadales bacterium]|nr:thermonuclease family protein [Nitrosomonadales bacterium]